MPVPALPLPARYKATINIRALPVGTCFWRRKVEACHFVKICSDIKRYIIYIYMPRKLSDSDIEVTYYCLQKDHEFSQIYVIFGVVTSCR